MHPPLPERIETPRLILRAPTAQDAPAIAEAVAASRAELHPWMPWARDSYGLSDAAAFCKAAAQARASGREWHLLLTRREDERIIGAAALIGADWSVPMFEIGYWLHSAATGSGYCTEAARALTRSAFERFGAQRVQIVMDARNARSRAVAERLGFEREALLRSHRRDSRGELGDTCIYALFDAAALRRDPSDQAHPRGISE